MSCSKGFSTSDDSQGLLFSSKFLAVAFCVIFIGSLTVYYYLFESGFNPVPQKSALQNASLCFPDRETCPGFLLSNESLRVFNRTDIISQQASFLVTVKQTGLLTSLAVYVDNVSLGMVSGPFAAGTARQIAVGVPTTMVVKPGSSYTIVFEGVISSSSASESKNYWQSITIVASSG